jgi:hypothetical protein
MSPTKHFIPYKIPENKVFCMVWSVWWHLVILLWTWLNVNSDILYMLQLVSHFGYAYVWHVLVEYNGHDVNFDILVCFEFILLGRLTCERLCTYKSFNVLFRNCSPYLNINFQYYRTISVDVFSWVVTEFLQITMRCHKHSTCIWSEDSVSGLLALCFLVVNMQGRKLG